MMLCDMLLSAGLIAAASCGQPDGGAEKAAAAQEPPALAGVQLEESAVPSGRRTGMTLADVTRDLNWRQAAFERMARGSTVEAEPAKPTPKTSF